MCLSVPLSTIQTFPLFLSFGIFFISPHVAFWVLKGLAPAQALAAPEALCTAVAWAVPGARRLEAAPFSPGLGCLGSERGPCRIPGALRKTRQDFSHLPANVGAGTAGVSP